MDKKIFITKWMTSTNDSLIDISIFLLRCTLGIVLFEVDSGKVFGWFGGFGLHASLQFYLKMRISLPFAYLSCFTEFIGGFLLIISLFSKPVVIAVIINMAVATIEMLPYGFIGQGGFSYPFSFLIMSIIIFLTGPMKYSFDYLLFNQKKY
jgi:putative oxidoreductase